MKFDRSRTLTISITVAALCLTMAGCSVKPDTPAVNSNQTGNPIAIASMLKKIRAVVPEATSSSVVLTKSTDPTGQLGQKDSYVKAAVVKDSRLTCVSLTSACGAEIKVWPSLTAAEKAITAAATSGTTIRQGIDTITVSGNLPQGAVSQYRTAWHQYFFG